MTKEQIIEEVDNYLADDPVTSKLINRNAGIGLARHIAEVVEKDTINNACSWLSTYYDEIGLRWMRGDDKEEIIEPFKNAMK